jgi:hypothetical protein
MVNALKPQHFAENTTGDYAAFFPYDKANQMH